MTTVDTDKDDAPIATPYSGRYRQDVYKEDPPPPVDENDVDPNQDEVDDSDAPLGAKNNPEVDREDRVNEALDQGKEDYKKRYEDLRRWANRKINEQNEVIKKLPKAPTLDDIPIPSSEAEMEEFKKKYPGVMKVIESVSILKSKDVSKDLKDKLETLEKDKKRLARREAELQIKEVHKDFDTIIKDDKFHEWLETKSSATQDGIYKNSTDSKWAIDVLNLYKAENNLTDTTNKTGKGKPVNEDPALAVRHPRTAPNITDNRNQKDLILESVIQKMKPHEFMAREKEIDKAMREGRIIYDLSGGQRPQG